MEQFNVLYDPWIPLEELGGKRIETGLLQALCDAHSYKGLCCESPLEEVAIHRLLIAFLMDAYRLKKYSDRKQLFKNGKFHSEHLQNYINVCESEGTSFDLFSKERPFMQATYCESLDKNKQSPAAKLIHTATSGNNHTHFEHHHENDYSLTYAQAIRALLASYLFCPALVQGYPSSVNNTPCNYYFCIGKTLFETLVLNMFAENHECGEIPVFNPPVAWRDTSVITPKQEYATMSLLAAFTWQPRRVTLIPEQGFVHEIYYQQGKNFSGNGLWQDPHAAYRKSEKGDWFTVKPQIGRSLWRDIGTLVNSGLGAETVFKPPQSVYRYGDITGKYDEYTIVPLRVAGLVTSNAALDELQEDILSIPLQLLNDPELGEYLQGDIKEIEQMATCVKKSYIKLGHNIAATLQGNFFAKWHRVLFPDYLDTLANIDVCADDWQQEMNKLFDKFMHDIIVEVKKTAERYIGASAKQLVLFTHCNQLLMKEYYALRKRRGLNEN